MGGCALPLRSPWHYRYFGMFVAVMQVWRGYQYLSICIEYLAILWGRCFAAAAAMAVFVILSFNIRCPFSLLVPSPADRIRYW